MGLMSLEEMIYTMVIYGETLSHCLVMLISLMACIFIEIHHPDSRNGQSLTDNIYCLNDWISLS